MSSVAVPVDGGGSLNVGLATHCDLWSMSTGRPMELIVENTLFLADGTQSSATELTSEGAGLRPGPEPLSKLARISALATAATSAMWAPSTKAPRRRRFPSRLRRWNLPTLFLRACGWVPTAASTAACAVRIAISAIWASMGHGPSPSTPGGRRGAGDARPGGCSSEGSCSISRGDVSVHTLGLTNWRLHLPVESRAGFTNFAAFAVMASMPTESRPPPQESVESRGSNDRFLVCMDLSLIHI